MIHIHFDQPSIQNWYADQMVPLVQSKHLRLKRKYTKDVLLMVFVHRLKSLSKNEIRDILLSPMEELSIRYDWIREYVMLCDVIALYPSFREKHQGHNVRKDRELFIIQYLPCRYFLEAFKKSGQTYNSAVRNWKHLEAVIRTAKKRLEDLNSVIEQKFNYSYLPEQIRGELVEKMGVSVCPYCNRQYIQPVTIDRKKRYLGDLDHILPKSYYQLFSLSLWNLTPSCKPCNQIFKKSRGARILNPQERGFDEDCILVLKYRTVRELVGIDLLEKMEWEIQPSASSDIRDQVENNLRTFRLNEVYDYNRRDIQRTLKRRHLAASSGYVKSLIRLSPWLIMDFASLWYGVSLDPSKFQEEMLAKAIYDTVLYN